MEHKLRWYLEWGFHERKGERKREGNKMECSMGPNRKATGLKKVSKRGSGDHRFQHQAKKEKLLRGEGETSQDRGGKIET